ncbi:HipA-like protein [Sphingobacterium paludis]|uniref:HipA-like protein n=1 Tax=Sphingobacterium paludis TaxID=1476465 RepID=A0A4R7CU69_9SPHI|nr:HipA-like protein [Sphingobacterium paludis]
MKKAEVNYKDLLAGILTENDDGEYIFQYDRAYVEK